MSSLFYQVVQTEPSGSQLGKSLFILKMINFTAYKKSRDSRCAVAETCSR